MATAVTIAEIDTLNQWCSDAKAGNRNVGLMLMARLSEIARDLSRWQWVMHGDTGTYRAAVVRWLCRSSRYTVGRRFALCGRGDQLGVSAGSTLVRVRTKGCGCRYCPRCSRRAGRKYLKKVNGHLSARPHGELWHIVFTQRAIAGEGLPECRGRFEVAWKKAMRWMRKAGLRGGLTTYHLIRNGFNAWHWHAHLVVELKDGVDGETFFSGTEDAWRSAKGRLGKDDIPIFGRRVCRQGVAMTGLVENGQMDFWSESQSEVEKAIQYVVRDVLQGVERWIAQCETSELVEEFCRGVEGAKMHRLVGEWRQKVAVVEVPGEADGAIEKPKVLPKAKEGADIIWDWIGTMDQVMYHARKGVFQCEEALSNLLRMGSNQGLVAARLRRAVDFLPA